MSQGSLSRVFLFLALPVIILVTMLALPHFVTATPSPPTGTIRQVGSAYAASSDVPGQTVGQVCPGDRLVLFRKTRFNEEVLWLRLSHAWAHLWTGEHRIRRLTAYINYGADHHEPIHSSRQSDAAGHYGS